VHIQTAAAGLQLSKHKCWSLSTIRRHNWHRLQHSGSIACYNSCVATMLMHPALNASTSTSSSSERRGLNSHLPCIANCNSLAKPECCNHTGPHQFSSMAQLVRVRKILQLDCGKGLPLAVIHQRQNLKGHHNFTHRLRTSKKV